MPLLNTLINRLTLGAEVCPPISDSYPFNGGAADRAGLATSVGYLKLKVGCPRTAVGAEVAIYASPLILNSCL